MTELKLFARERVGPVWGVGFPLLLLIIFGSIPSFSQPRRVLGGFTELDVYVPILIAFVIAMLSLNALPPVLAGYREKGILRRLQTTPVGPVRVLAAQLAVNLAVAAVTVTVILAVARLGYGVFLPRQLAGFALAALLAAISLLAVGLFVAAAAPT
ncbi:MAG: ABC transporter permease, partial [Streptosporangiaceae bacterium]